MDGMNNAQQYAVRTSTGILTNGVETYDRAIIIASQTGGTVVVREVTPWRDAE